MRPMMVTHASTDQARCRVTLLIHEATPLLCHAANYRRVSGMEKECFPSNDSPGLAPERVAGCTCFSDAVYKAVLVACNLE